MRPPPPPDTQRISYQLPRDVLIRIWWRRMMLRPRRLIATAILLIFTGISFALGDGMEYVGIIFLIWAVMMPINLYRVLAKTVATQKELTDPRTVDFTSSRIVASGPDWKTEVPWTKYQGFSEDAA